jgi:S-formylglutathione hydrolase FrmB
MAFITMQYNSVALGRGISVHVILPSDGISMVNHEPPYKTVYFLTGYSVDATSLVSYLPFRKECELKGLAAVIISGENAFYQDKPERGENYAQLVGKEIVEVTRNFFPLSDKREDTYIAGISMGGYGALLNGIRFRETFSKIAALSPACDPDNLLNDFQELGFHSDTFQNIFGSKHDYENGGANLYKVYPKTSIESIPELFIACGIGDTLVYPTVKRFVNTLEEAGIPHVFKTSMGNHEMDFWERMMDSTFSFLAGISEGTKDRLVLGF